ncbi:MAG: hypothetical protein Q9169_003947 [Polycauliona sp. 2 TL-2023]
MEEETHESQRFEVKEHRTPGPVTLPLPYGSVPTSLDFHLIPSAHHPFLEIEQPTFACKHGPPLPVVLPSLERTEPTTNWLAPLSLTYGLSTSCPTTFLSLPRALRQLSLASSIPCGVLVLVGLVSPKDAPEWESPQSPESDHLEKHERFSSQQQAIRREKLLPEEQQRQAASLRQAEELTAIGTRIKKEQRERAEKDERREREAVNSARMEIDLIANAALKRMEGEGLFKVKANSNKDLLQTAVEQLLLGIYGAAVGKKAQEWALDACTMLDRWQDWAGRGGMTTKDLKAVLKDKEAFYWAAVAVGLVTKVCGEDGADGDGLPNDIRECLRAWNKVRLG